MSIILMKTESDSIKIDQVMGLTETYRISLKSGGKIIWQLIS